MWTAQSWREGAKTTAGQQASQVTWPDKKQPEESAWRSLPWETPVVNVMPMYIGRWNEAGGREFGVKLWRTFRKPSRRILICIQKRKFEFSVFHSSATMGLYIAIIQWILHINLPQRAQSWLHTGTNCITLNKTSQCAHHTLGRPISISGQDSDPSEAQSSLGDSAEWGTWARRRDNSHLLVYSSQVLLCGGNCK